MAAIRINDAVINAKEIMGQHSISISPDGAFVAYVIQEQDDNPPKTVSPYTPPIYYGACVQVSGIDSEKTYVPLGTGNSWSPSWSPDGSKLALYGDESGAVKIYIWDTATQGIHQVSQAMARGFGHMHDRPRWLNDHTICLLFMPEEDGFDGYLAEEDHGSDNASGQPTGEELFWTPRQRTESEDSAAPQADLYYKVRSDIGIIDIDTGDVKRLVVRQKAKYAFPSPDGRYIAFNTFEPRLSLNRFEWSEGLCLIKADGTEPVVQLACGLPSDGGGRHVPAWSPDSQALAYIKGDEIHIWRFQTGALYIEEITPIDGIKAYDRRFLLWTPDGQGLILLRNGNLTKLGLDGNTHAFTIPGGLQPRGVLHRIGETSLWNPDGISLVLWAVDTSTRDHGFYAVSLDGGAARCIYREAQAISASPFSDINGIYADVSKTGDRVVFAMENIGKPMELYVADPQFSEARQVTKVNPELTVPKHTPINESMVFWRSSSGAERRGILLLPGESRRKAPLIVSVYPNIDNCVRAHTWDLETASAILPVQLLVMSGYAVFIPNLYARGENFVEEASVEFQDAVAAIKNIDAIDHSRIGIMGHSFGGETVNCLITRIPWLKAAVSSAGCGDWAHLWGTSSAITGGQIDGYGCQFVETQHIGPELGPPWENPEAYVRNSPVYHLDRVETPLLMIGGAQDSLYQPEEILVGLERLGRKVQCFRYKGEGHTPREWSLTNRRDIASRVLAFFDCHLK